MDTILRAAVTNYVSDKSERQKMLALVPEIDKRARAIMREGLAGDPQPMPDIIRKVTNEVNGFSPEAKQQFFDVLEKVPMAYQKTNAIFATPEKKAPGGVVTRYHLKVGLLDEDAEVPEDRLECSHEKACVVIWRHGPWVSAVTCTRDLLKARARALQEESARERFIRLGRGRSAG